MKRITLLLTGTVNPGQMVFTKLTDPDLRRNQYIESLNYWLEKVAFPIVFVENSGVDISSAINPKYSRRIEFLTFLGNNYDKQLGKGYGEMRCLEYASLNSSFFKLSDFVFKVTGRLKILNFEKFDRYYQKNPTTLLLLDLKDSLKFADSRIFGFYPEFLEDYLIKYQHEINDSSGKAFENILAKAALEAIIDEKEFNQLPFYPRLDGVSGTDNQPYSKNYFYNQLKQVKYFLKARFMQGY